MMYFIPEEENNDNKVIEEYVEGDWNCVKVTEISKDGLRQVIQIRKERKPTLEDQLLSIDQLIDDYVANENFLKAAELVKEKKALINKESQPPQLGDQDY